MSTDAPETALLPQPVRTAYAAIPHRDSNNSRRRGLCGWVMGKLGKPERKNHTTFQIVRSNDPHASDLPKGINPAVARQMRSKYPVPFVGLKQQRKMEGLV